MGQLNQSGEGLGVTSADSPVLRRLFLGRELLRGPARWALAWSILAALSVLLILLVFSLVISLLVGRGEVTLSLTLNEALVFEKLTGELVLSDEQREVAQKLMIGQEPEALGALQRGDVEAKGAVEAEPDTGEPVADATDMVKEPIEKTIELRLTDSGLLPAVWRTRGTWFNPVLVSMCKLLPGLKANVSALGILLAFAAGLALFRVFCLSQLRMLCRAAALELGLGLRKNVYRQAMRLGCEDLSGDAAQETKRLFTFEIGRIESGVFSGLLHLLRYPPKLMAYAIAMLSVDPLLCMQWLLPVGLAGYALETSRRRLTTARNLASDRAAHDLRQLSESLDQARLVKGYGIDQGEQSEFQTTLGRFTRAVKEKTRFDDDSLWLRLVAICACVAIVAFLLFITLTKVLMDSSSLSMPGAMVFLVALLFMFPAVMAIVREADRREEIVEAASKVFRYLDRIPTVSQTVGAKFLQPLANELRFEQVVYQLPGESQPVLDRLDLKLKAGKKYAIVSLDGMGAKCVAALLTRFIEPQSGQIFFDGEDIAGATLESLRAETILASATDRPLAGTILENIQAGGKYSMQQVTDAAKETHAHNFIVGLFHGYETVIDPNALTLDIGQQFRLALARAMVKRPALLVVEEPNAIFDEDTKSLLEDAYNRISRERTVIYLPTRLATLRRVDEIIVLWEGRVEAMGPHEVLVNKSPVYRHWEYMHFHEFRLLEGAKR
jgi:ABC-type multidrug transport system fused ATPase/permease subunit